MGENGEALTEEATRAYEQVSGSDASNPSVLIVHEPGEKPGEYRIAILEFNGMNPLAVPTLLRAAASIREKQLGV